MCIIDAVKRGDLVVVLNLLNNKEKPITKSDCTAALQKACSMGNLEIVNCLLEDGEKRADPSAYNLEPQVFFDDRSSNYALQLAVEYGAIAVVNRLLQDDRVDPAASNNNPIKLAAFYGRAEIVERLLQNNRVNPAVNQYEALRFAIKRGHDKVANLLINHQNLGSQCLNKILPNLSSEKEKTLAKRLQAGYSFDKFGFFHHTALVSDVVQRIGLKLFQLEFEQQNPTQGSTKCRAGE